MRLFPASRPPFRRAFLLAWALLCFGAVAPRALRAELIVLDNGHVLKVESYEIDVETGDRMRLALVSGGRLTLPLASVERVVDDEISPEPVPVPEPIPDAMSPLFDESAVVPATPYGELIYEMAARHRLNPLLVAAVVQAESAYDSRALSPKGARGLMQLMPATARRFGARDADLFDPRVNLEAGSRYLSWLLEHFGGDLTRALAAYNAGEGAVARYGGVPPYRETRHYLRRVYAILGLMLPESPGLS